MARSLKKGPFVDGHLMAKVEKVSENGKKEVVAFDLIILILSQC